MKLIENLPNHHKDKEEYLLNLKDSIEIPTVSIKCRKYGHHATECEKCKKETNWHRYKTSNTCGFQLAQLVKSLMVV